MTPSESSLGTNCKYEHSSSEIIVAWNTPDSKGFGDEDRDGERNNSADAI
jgi:hypothetical protein